jgi:hypothetical protein
MAHPTALFLFLMGQSRFSLEKFQDTSAAQRASFTRRFRERSAGSSNTSDERGTAKPQRSKTERDARGFVEAARV